MTSSRRNPWVWVDLDIWMAAEEEEEGDDDMSTSRALAESLWEAYHDMVAHYYGGDAPADKKCECGSEKAEVPGHSTWCPKYRPLDMETDD